MEIKKTIPLFLLFFLSQVIMGQTNNSLFDDISSDQKNQELLPSSMIFTQRLLWGEKGLMR
ncbi:MAG: hypothetical protein HN625_08695, partial [Flavobacteriaceae bacterium]|nr:hypothetical protein [Flavobacteriaceae bacterium]